MKEIIKPWSIGIWFLLSFFSGLFSNVLPAYVFIFSTFLSVFGSKYLQYYGDRLEGFDVELVYNKMGLPKVKYRNMKLLKINAVKMLLIPKTLVLEILLLFSIIFVSKSENANTNLLGYMFLGSLVGAMIDYKSLKIIWFLVKWNCFYVRLEGDNIDCVKDTEKIKYNHRLSYYYREYFKNYDLHELKNELIHLNQSIFNKNKFNFLENFLLPFMFLLAGGLISGTSVLVLYGLEDKKSITFEEAMLIYFALILGIALTLFIIFLYIYFIVQFFSRKNFLETQKQVVEELIDKKTEMKKEKTFLTYK